MRFLIEWEANGIEVEIDLVVVKWSFSFQHLELPL